MSDFLNTVDSIGDEALTNSIICRSITEILDNYVKNIGNHAFNGCKALITVDFPAATSIGAYAFKGCQSLITVDFPAATSIGTYAFDGCQSLITVDFPAATSIGTYAFYNCSELTTADFPAATRIDNYAFWYCSSLTALILRSKTMANLSSTNAFNSTPIKSGTGYIYVPAALVDSYKAASNWRTYANQIRAIEDYPEICG